MVARDIQLVEYTGGRYHVAHVSTAATVQLVRQAKARGLQVTLRGRPASLHADRRGCPRIRHEHKDESAAPPEEDVEAVKEGLRDGTIEVIATDHAPHSFDEKQVEYPAAPFGIVGLETALGLVLTELFHKHVLSLQQIIEKLSLHPRRILGLPPVAIEEGAAANLTIFDPAAEWVVSPELFRSRSRNTPFGGMRLKGRPVGIINNGADFWL